MNKHFKIFLLLLSLTLIVYLPVINKGLASDDYDVLHRIVFEQIFYIDGFFRPLSDVSLYFCYLIGGFNSWIYNLFNVLLHVASAFLLYKTCLFLFNKSNNDSLIALTAAIFFVLYPFHNEAIVWVVGRASNLSCFLAFSALYIVLSRKISLFTGIVAAVLYFGSLSTYETSITLPVIAALLLWLKYPDEKRWLKIFLLFSGIVILNLLIRSLLVKEIVGDYGSRMFDPSLMNNLIKFLKTTGRLFLPPTPHTQLIVILAILVFLIIGLIFILIWKKELVAKKQFMISSACVLFACAIPFLFGVNTRTIEGDRLLYFPSFFLCIWISLAMIKLLSRKNYYRFSLAFGLYFFVFLQVNNYTWRKADQISKTILVDMSNFRPINAQMLIYRLPEEYKGAHVFRNGFLEALIIHGIDTTGIKIGSFQGPSENAELGHIYHPKPDRFGKFFWGDSIVEWKQNKLEIPIIYWNNQNLVFFR